MIFFFISRACCKILTGHDSVGAVLMIPAVTTFTYRWIYIWLHGFTCLCVAAKNTKQQRFVFLLCLLVCTSQTCLCVFGFERLLRQDQTVNPFFPCWLHVQVYHIYSLEDFFYYYLLPNTCMFLYIFIVVMCRGWLQGFYGSNSSFECFCLVHGIIQVFLVLLTALASAGPG